MSKAAVFLLSLVLLSSAFAAIVGTSNAAYSKNNLVLASTGKNVG